MAAIPGFRVAPILVDPHLCLNYVHIHVRCEICKDVCPVDAISLGDGVEVDRDLCVRCGACVWKCPVGVFAHRRLYEADLLDISDTVDGSIELACPLSSASKASASAKIVLPICLASLAPSLLMRLAGDRLVILNDSKCDMCALGLRPIVIDAVGSANAWIKAWGRDGQIELASEHPDLPGATEESQTFELSERLDRRNFLLALASGSVHLPERQRVIELLSEWPGPENRLVATDALGLAALEVRSDLCIACGHCAEFCPTSALEFSLEPGRFSLTFSPLACVDCGICSLVCQPKAFTRRQDIPVAAIEAVVTLVEGGWHHCERCGQVTADRTGKLCFWCTLSENPPDVGTLLGEHFPTG